MKPLIIIPARGGSKGIPHKNITPLAGRPLIAYTIDVALQVAADLQLPKENLLLSTDSSEIAAVVESCGLECEYMRPAELANDTASSRDAMLHAMDWADTHGIGYDCVLLLQPTSPLRTAADVHACLNVYSTAIKAAEKATDVQMPDMAVSVKEASANPYYNCFETNPLTGALIISKGSGLLTRRQDAPPAWEFNGAVYVINPQSLRAMPMGSFPVRLPSPMTAEHSVDIDSPLDLVIAEAIINSNRNNE